MASPRSPRSSPLGTATRHFADPDFDGDPALVEEITIDESGEQIGVTEIEIEAPPDVPAIEYEHPEEKIGADTGTMIN